MIGIGAWLFVLTVAGFVIEYRAYVTQREDRQEERAARRLDRISQAWETLLRPVGGNTGKGSALNILLQDGQSLQGADLTCRSIGEWRDDECTRPAILADVELSWSEAETGGRVSIYDRFVLDRTDFSGNVFYDLRANYLNLDRHFRDVIGVQWRISNLSAVRSPEEANPLGNFRCTSCYVGSGQLMWDVYLRFNRSLLRDTWIFVPADIDARAAASLKNQTFLDAPPRFMRFETSASVLPLYFLGFWSAERFQQGLAWDIYRGLDYCVNPEDQKLLELPPLRVAMDGRISDRQPLIGMSGIQVEDSGYRCGLEFDQVERLLRIRLTEWQATAARERHEVGTTQLPK